MRARSDGRFEAFDGLRASAAVLVLTYHVLLGSGLTRAGALAPLAAALKGGVTVFFVISGFLLYLPYARAIRSGGPPPDWREFARRRAVRILPAYWVALTVLGLGPLRGSVLTSNWWRYYGLTQTYDPDTIFTGLPVAWSLCVEVSFYAVLPIMARGLAALVERSGVAHAARTQLGAMAVVTLGALGLRAALCHSLLGQVPHPGVVLATTLPGMLDWFAIGIALAVLAAEWELDPDHARPVAALASRPARCWALAACFFVAGAAAQGGDLFLPLYGVGAHAAFGAAAALFVLPAVRPAARAARLPVLSLPPMSWLGMVSYGIYLWHVPLLHAIEGSTVPSHPLSAAHALGLFAIVAAGGILLGAASWYVVEQPAQRLARRRAPAPALATS
jgi:peptidoglycan/LPS O-acetylase OafA/YrhL